MAGPINLSGAQGAQAGDGNQQLNVFGPLIRELTLAAVPAPREPGPTVVGTIPQQAAAFRPRPALAAALMAGPAAGVLVHAVTGMRGVGKTQLAAAYARNRLDAGWRLVAWVNAATRPSCWPAWRGWRPPLASANRPGIRTGPGRPSGAASRQTASAACWSSTTWPTWPGCGRSCRRPGGPRW